MQLGNAAGHAGLLAVVHLLAFLARAVELLRAVAGQHKVALTDGGNAAMLQREMIQQVAHRQIADILAAFQRVGDQNSRCIGARKGGKIVNFAVLLNAGGVGFLGVVQNLADIVALQLLLPQLHGVAVPRALHFQLQFAVQHQHAG